MTTPATRISTPTKTGSNNLPKLDFSKKGLEEVKELEICTGEDRTKHIQVLLFSNNKLSKFVVTPRLVSHFPNLKALFLNGNNLVEVPEQIGQFVHLVKLHLENNQIRIIPKSIRQLQELKKLYLANNNLQELPDEIGYLPQLEVLRINDNHIRVLPVTLAICSNLKELSLHNNPIESPPPFIYNKGMIQLQRYLTEVRISHLMDTPRDEFIFSRKVSFADSLTKIKRAPSAKNFTLTSSIKISNKEATKAVNAINKKGSEVFERKLQEDQISLNQNHLLYFLTEYYITEEQGRRDYMEDRSVGFPRMRQSKTTKLNDEVVNLFSKVAFFGVYDGHGGDKCAEYMKDVLHKNICNQEAFAKGDFERAMKLGFKKTDEEFLQMCREEALLDGSTCLVVLVIDNKLVVGHAGDSRAVLCRDKKAIRLTEDHKPDRVDELARIEEAGGEVIYRGNCFRVQGDLAMSRSFGDLRLKEPVHLVISDPEIKVEELTPKDQFIILASDGLWDVMSDQKAVDIVKKCSSVEEASKRLVETAMALGTLDNTTAIVVKLNWNLDFLTQDEIDGKISYAKQKPKEKERASVSTKDKEITLGSSPSSGTIGKVGVSAMEQESEISEEQLEKMRSNSFSIRDAFENITEDSPASTRKSIYLPVSNDVPAVKVKILVPLISATKLMKFEISIKVKDIIRVLILKHRFTGQIEEFIMVHKGDHEALDLPLDHEKTLQDYHIKDNDQLELKASNSTAMNSKPKPQETQTNDNLNDEALPPPELVAISTLRRNNKMVQEAKKNSSDEVKQPTNPAPAPAQQPVDTRNRSQSEIPNLNKAPADPPRRNTQAEIAISPDALRRNTSPPPPPMAQRGSQEPEQTPPTFDSTVEIPPEETVYVGSPKEEVIPPSPSPAPQPISTPTNNRTGASRVQTNTNPVSSPEPMKKNGDTNMVEVIGSVFRLENGTWKPLDGGSSRVAIIMNQEGKYRVVALSQSGQFVVNAWIRTERPFKRVSETFCNFPTVSNRQHVTFGIRLRSSEDASQFTSIFESCVEKLKESQAKNGGQSEPMSPQSLPKPEEPVKLRETFNL